MPYLHLRNPPCAPRSTLDHARRGVAVVALPSSAIPTYNSGYASASKGKEGEIPVEHTVTVTIDDEGRLRLPRALSEQLGLVAGTTLVVEPVSDEAVQFRVEVPSPLVEKEGVLVVRAAATGDLSAAVQASRAARLDIFDPQDAA
jgi:bifunctional DNA-binding transcriptional regulator/antitoxin component of YhaV-PrlF toxin-antitoxin module